MEYELLSTKYENPRLLGGAGARIEVRRWLDGTGFEDAISSLRDSYQRLAQANKSVDEIAAELDKELLPIIYKFDSEVPMP